MQLVGGAPGASATARVTCLQTGFVGASQVMLAMFIAMLNFVVPQLTDSLEVGAPNAMCSPPPAK